MKKCPLCSQEWFEIGYGMSLITHLIGFHLRDQWKEKIVCWCGERFRSKVEFINHVDKLKQKNLERTADALVLHYYDTLMGVKDEQ